MMKVSKDLSVVQSEQKLLEQLLTNFSEINLSYKGLLSSSEVIADEVNSQLFDLAVANFKTELYGWMHSRRPQDDCSRSQISVRSKSSSAHSTASQRAMQQKAKLAALEEELKFAEREAELDRMSRLLRLDKETAIARAELMVFEEADQEDQGLDTVPSGASLECRQPPLLASSDNALPVKQLVSHLIGLASNTPQREMQSYQPSRGSVLPPASNPVIFNPSQPPPGFALVEVQQIPISHSAAVAEYEPRLSTNVQPHPQMQNLAALDRRSYRCQVQQPSSSHVNRPLIIRPHLMNGRERCVQTTLQAAGNLIVA
jgi:hypothetical protein